MRFHAVAAIGVVTVVLMLAFGWRVRYRLSVTNETAVPIRVLVVEAGDDTIRFADIPPGGTVSAPFHFGNEVSFRVAGKLADGTPIDDSVGYVVWERVAVRSAIAIRPGGEVRYSAWQFP